ncbi:MAG: HEAT repeat domain-containing protein, partial [Candidatus Hydrogenedentes bacterium]|nr:HEAT repeat domain-containing protein [Candidatus Hydrogenedentota bacterium]
RAALHLLETAGGDSEVAAIAKLLQEPSLAEDARTALDRIPGPAATQALISALATVPQDVRLSLFDTLARRLAVESQDGASASRGSDVSAGRENAIRAIGPFAGNSDSETRWRAFESLCKMGVAPNSLPVSPQVFVRENRQRYMAGFVTSAYANLVLGKNELAENMFATLAAFPIGDSQACAALIGLAKLNSPKLIEHALGYLAEPGIRDTAIETLTTANIPSIDDRLSKGLTYTNPSNRATMIRILAARKSPNVGELLATMKQDPAPEVRLAAIESLGETPSDAELKEALLKSTPWTREHAGRLLLQRADSSLATGDTDKARSLLETVASANVSAEMRAEATQILAQAGGPAPQTTTDAAQSQGIVPLPNAHSHNDYEHVRPLLDALDRGFCSVEADIYLVEGQLLVAHNRGDVKPERTLQALYLDPLKERVKKNGGRVYPGGTSLTLLIDFKTEADSTYAVLRDVLAKYSDVLTRFTPDATQEGAITIILSGNSPREQVSKEPERYVAIDGRPGDLDGDINPNLVPLISESWRSLFKWWGDGPMPEDQHAKLVDIVTRAHAKGCRVRFWATPEREDLWQLLRDTGVDLLNTDQLPRLQAFLLEPTKK